MQAHDYVHQYQRMMARACVVGAVALCVIALALLVLTLWLVFAKQDSKLYEADNVVCISQPFAVQCFQRSH